MRLHTISDATNSNLSWSLLIASLQILEHLQQATHVLSTMPPCGEENLVSVFVSTPGTQAMQLSWSQLCLVRCAQEPKACKDTCTYCDSVWLNEILYKQALELLRTHAIQQRNQLDWIGYLSSTSVYGDWGGAWVDERSLSACQTLQATDSADVDIAWLNRPSVHLNIHLGQRCEGRMCIVPAVLRTHALTGHVHCCCVLPGSPPDTCCPET